MQPNCLAILDLHRTAITELRTDNGIYLMATYVQGLATAAENAGTEPAENAGIEPVGADICRAARILDCHGRNDTADINQAVQEAIAADRPTQLVVALLDLYEVLLPELTSEAGIDWLNRCISAFANEEVQDQ